MSRMITTVSEIQRESAPLLTHSPRICGLSASNPGIEGERGALETLGSVHLVTVAVLLPVGGAEGGRVVQDDLGDGRHM